MEIIDLTADERDKSQEINREDDEITLVPVSEVVDLIHDVDGSRRCSFKRELSFSENIWESKTEYSLENNNVKPLPRSRTGIYFYCERCQSIIQEMAVLRICGCVRKFLPPISAGQIMLTSL